jgi:hypothetical protein
MIKKEYHSFCMYVDGFGIMRDVRILHQAKKGFDYLVIKIGEIKCLAYGRGVDDFQKLLPGEMVYLQGEVKTDNQGMVVFISRYKFLGDLFGEFIDCGPMPEIEGFATNERIVVALKDRLPGGKHYIDTIRV